LVYKKSAKTDTTINKLLTLTIELTLANSVPLFSVDEPVTAAVEVTALPDEVVGWLLVAWEEAAEAAEVMAKEEEVPVAGLEVTAPVTAPVAAPVTPTEAAELADTEEVPLTEVEPMDDADDADDVAAADVEEAKVEDAAEVEVEEVEVVVTPAEVLEDVTALVVAALVVAALVVAARVVITPVVPVVPVVQGLITEEEQCCPVLHAVVSSVQ